MRTSTHAAVLRAMGVVVGVNGAALLGCTAESVRIALETQRRADDVQQGIFDRQHEGLRVLLYRDLVAKLAAGEGGLTDEQRTLVNHAWNERDLIEFWAVQFERSKALRLVGVDAKLYADQAIVDLLIKALDAKADRANQALRNAAAEQAAPRASAPRGSEPLAPSEGPTRMSEPLAPSEGPGVRAQDTAIKPDPRPASTPDPVLGARGSDRTATAEDQP